MLAPIISAAPVYKIAFILFVVCPAGKARGLLLIVYN
jgi:hypothetical protein